MSDIIEKEIEDEDCSHEPASEVAKEIADNTGLDDGTAMRQLLAIQIDVLENCMVSLWDISDALKLRTVAGKPKADS